MFSRRPGHRFNRGRIAIGGSAVLTDPRQFLTSSELLAYWDLRPDISGASTSVTMSATMASEGTTPPTVTLSGNLNQARQVKIKYPVGGVRGVATYAIDFGDGYTDASGAYRMTGVTAAGPIDIGSGQFVSFGAGTYVGYGLDGTTAGGGSGANIHWAKVESWAELTGRANCTFTDTAAGGAGHRFEAKGMNGVSPSLYMWNSYLQNAVGVPALATGVDTPIEVWMVYETWSLTNGAGAFRPWSFSNSGDATKGIIDMYVGGPSLTGRESRWGMNRRDSGGTPATAELIGNTSKVDLDPKVIRAIPYGASGQLWISGKPARSSNVNMNRSVATTVDRCTIGASGPGTNPAQGRVSAFVITAALSDAKALQMLKALP